MELTKLCDTMFDAYINALPDWEREPLDWDEVDELVSMLTDKLNHSEWNW